MNHLNLCLCRLSVFDCELLIVLFHVFAVVMFTPAE